MKKAIFSNAVIVLTETADLAARLEKALALVRLLDASVNIICVGPGITSAAQSALELLKESDSGSHSPEISAVADNSELLSNLVKLRPELIIIWAESREGLIRYYSGSLSRQLIRKTDSSILIIKGSGSKDSPDYKHVVVNAPEHPKTAHTIQTAYHWVAVSKNTSWELAVEMDSDEKKEPPRPLSSIRVKKTVQKRSEEAEKKRIEKVLAGLDPTIGELPETHFLKGKQGSSVVSYAESSGADLLVINSPDTKLGYLDRVFTQDLEYILSEQPCDLLIVHSHKN